MLAHSIPANHAADDAALRAKPHPLPQQIVDQIDCGLIVCRADGHVLHANRAAQRELDSARVLTLRDGALCCQGPSAPELASAIQSAAERGMRRLVHLRCDQPLMLVLTPLDTPPDASPLALVMIGRRTLCTPLGLELLALQHRLTWAEQRVLRAIVGGLAVREIAADNGVAVSTIRTQVQSVRDKLGAGNIDGLLVIAACIPPVPSCH